MKRRILPLLTLIALMLALFSGCQASIDKAKEYYEDLKGYVDDAKEFVGELGEKAGEAIDNIGSFFSGEKPAEGNDSAQAGNYGFRTREQLDSHFEKHGSEFGGISREEYLRLANQLISDPNALQKTDPDGDRLFYSEERNEFAVLTSDGFIRTFFRPEDGVDYWNRQ